MPIVNLQLDSYKKANDSKIQLEMEFNASLDNQRLPTWALKEYHGMNQPAWYQNSITVNQINADVLQESFTLDNAKSTVFLKILQLHRKYILNY